MKISILILLIMLIITTTGLNAGTQRDFGFGAMEIFEFSNLTFSLRVYDMNRDGLDDILFLDNQVSRLEILIRKKSSAVGEELPALDERFIKKGFVLDNWAIDFQVADLNRDNRPDIVTLDDRRGIQIYFQQPEGGFGEYVVLSLKDPAKLKGFEIADLNNDGNMDILAIRQEKAEILQNSGQGKFKTQAEVDFSAYGCQEVMVMDINGDKIPDLLLYFPKEGLPLRVRPGKGEGQFGWEEALDLPDTRVIEKMDLIEGGVYQLGTILKNGLIMRLYGFSSQPGRPLFSEIKSEAIPRRLPLKGVSLKRAPSWAAADIDSDGYTDFCAAAPLLNQVHLYKGSETGLSFTPMVLDSLRDIKTISMTGPGDLVVFSETEKAIAIHMNKNLIAFPLFFKAPGEPAAAAAADANVFTLFKDQNLDYMLHLFNSQKPGDPPFESYKTTLRNTPAAMEVFPLDGAGNAA
ncbi:MAG TPA: VCBS repeat-containing protein, partial [Candidatus Deferrimicrobium sp.]|nr:VCBS repeat-containing protein [Candidatus Deferrimicrobium sp.]